MNDLQGLTKRSTLQDDKGLSGEAYKAKIAKDRVKRGHYLLGVLMGQVTW